MAELGCELEKKIISDCELEKKIISGCWVLESTGFHINDKTRDTLLLLTVENSYAMIVRVSHLFNLNHPNDGLDIPKF